MTHVVEEPDEADAEQAEPVELEDQQVRRLAAHRLLGKLLGLLEAQAQDDEDEGEDDADAQAGAPDGGVVGVVRGGGDDVWPGQRTDRGRGGWSDGYSQGTKAPKTKPRSIMLLVKRMNQRLRVPLLSSPLDSAQPTLPAGYSPADRQTVSQSPFFEDAEARGDAPPMPMPTKKRHAASMLNMPTASPL